MQPIRRRVHVKKNFNPPAPTSIYKPIVLLSPQKSGTAGGVLDCSEKEVFGERNSISSPPHFLGRLEESLGSRHLPLSLSLSLFSLQGTLLSLARHISLRIGSGSVLACLLFLRRGPQPSTICIDQRYRLRVSSSSSQIHTD